MSLNLFKNIFKGDKVIWMVYFFLSLISIIEVYSATSTLSYKTGDYWGPIMSHSVFIFMGAILVWGIHLIPCRWFKLLPVFLLPLSFILLIAVFFIGSSENDASRWLPIFGIKFQPSEMAKGAVIISVAQILSAMQGEKQANPKAFKYIMWITVGICALIAPENLSTAALLFGVVVLMMFVGRISMVQLTKMFVVIGLMLAAAISIVMLVPKDSDTSTGVTHRLVTWQNRIKNFGEDKDTLDLTGKDAQTAHAQIAIATSNGIGKLPGNSVERDFLPQAYSDFIYAIIIEELGLFGGIFVIFLYILLLVRAGRIASQSEKNFPALLIMGLALMLVCQAILNMMVAVGLFPVTGQNLPLISRGGTSMLINSCYIGMMLSISRYVSKKQEIKLGIETQETEKSMTNMYYNDENLK